MKSNLLAIMDTIMRLPSIFPNALALLTFLAAPLQTAFSQAAEAPPGPAAGQASANLPQADPAKELKLPGLVVNQKDRCVDLDATVCLKQGALELIACTKGTKDSDGEGPPRYLCDTSGHVISIATFGDEVLCLPDVHSSDNGALMWSIDSTHLPALDSKIILRLRPHAKPADKTHNKTQ